MCEFPSICFAKFVANSYVKHKLSWRKCDRIFCVRTKHYRETAELNNKGSYFVCSIQTETRVTVTISLIITFIHIEFSYYFVAHCFSSIETYFCKSGCMNVHQRQNKRDCKHQAQLLNGVRVLKKWRVCLWSIINKVSGIHLVSCFAWWQRICFTVLPACLFHSEQIIAKLSQLIWEPVSVPFGSILVGMAHWQIAVTPNFIVQL